MKPSQIEKHYSAGYQIGLDALDECSKINDERNVLAGLMSVVMHAAFAMAPSEDSAQSLIMWAKDTALENWRNQ